VTEQMRAITVQQPWAWAIATGHKTVENRGSGGWPADTYAVHAGRRWSARGAHDERMIDAAIVDGGADPADPDLARTRVDLVRRGLPRTDVARFTPGAVIAVVRVVDVHHDDGCCRPWGESLYPEAAGRIRTEVWHLVLEDPVALPHPVPCPGQLGPWNLPTDCATRVLDQLVGGHRAQ
jgi:hypothetical protein